MSAKTPINPTCCPETVQNSPFLGHWTRKTRSSAVHGVHTVHTTPTQRHTLPNVRRAGATPRYARVTTGPAHASPYADADPRRVSPHPDNARITSTTPTSTRATASRRDYAAPTRGPTGGGLMRGRGLGLGGRPARFWRSPSGVASFASVLRPRCAGVLSLP